MSAPERAAPVCAILFETARPEALAEFYRRAFDLPEPSGGGAHPVGMTAGGVYLGFDPAPARPAGDRPPLSVWFRVRDVADAHARLLALGATARTAPDPDASAGEVLATVFDPDGNVVGLVGPAPGS